PLPPHETEKAIDDICESFNTVLDSCVIDSLVLIPIFINDFLCIHPFNDGNGRMSRLLTTLLLYRCGYVVGRYISLESKIEKTKLKYYDVLEECGINWNENTNNPVPFIKYILGIILAAYRDFEMRVDYVDEKLPAIEQVRKAVCDKIGKFTKSEIMELLPSIGKASIENSLKKLMEEEFITRHGKGKATFYTRNDM
ncbi:MAG: Fic family protein, partial [Eubacteriales bacterium]